MDDIKIVSYTCEDGLETFTYKEFFAEQTLTLRGNLMLDREFIGLDSTFYTPLALDEFNSRMNEALKRYDESTVTLEYVFDGSSWATYNHNLVIKGMAVPLDWMMDTIKQLKDKLPAFLEESKDAELKAARDLEAKEKEELARLKAKYE